MRISPGRKWVFSGLAFCLAAAALQAPAGRISLLASDPPPRDLAGFAIPEKTAHPKIDSALWRAVRGAGHANDGRVSDDSLRVVIEISESRPGDPKTFASSLVRYRIGALGGSIEAESGRYVQAQIPAAAVELLAGDALISRLRLPYVPRPAAILSEGVARSGAMNWIDVPSYRGPENPVKIAVLDLGFQGYTNLLGSELPTNVVASSFRSDGNISAGTSHGTACAEIIHDMAPEAKIYLVNFATDVEQHAAVNYLISEKVDVISYSLIWPGTGAGNGTGPICEDVKKCDAEGIVWVGAAGDDAQSHWEGTSSDPNGDLFQNFEENDEILQWQVPAGTWTGATLSWNDWGTWTGSAYGNPIQDYDLLLWRWTGTAWELLEYCDDWQTGAAGQKPVERTSLWKSATDTWYGVSILKFDATINNSLELFVQGNSGAIEYDVPSGSVGIPADADEGLSVGATVAETDVLEAFSSRGPTNDGRIKPDLTGFSGVTTSALGPKAFSGTSAAAPHVAGAIGLLLTKSPYSPGQIRTILESRALDLGTSGKDNLYGFGRLYLK